MPNREILWNIVLVPNSEILRLVPNSEILWQVPTSALQLASIFLCSEVEAQMFITAEPITRSLTATIALPSVQFSAYEEGFQIGKDLVEPPTGKIIPTMFLSPHSSMVPFKFFINQRKASDYLAGVSMCVGCGTGQWTYFLRVMGGGDTAMCSSLGVAFE